MLEDHKFVTIAAGHGISGFAPAGMKTHMTFSIAELVGLLISLIPPVRNLGGV
jgi:hypothetical protein